MTAGAIMRYVALLASSRSYGHTRALLDFITAGRAVEFLDINDFKIAPYSYTHRYEDDGFLTILDRILAAEVIIFATPVYWYTMSGQLKIFFDRLTDLVRQHRELRGELVGKLCFAVATSESRTLPPGFEVPFEMTCHYLGMHWGGCFHGYYFGEGRISRRTLADARRFARMVFMDEQR
jgi:multimeric flavodoxin WrbA